MKRVFGISLFILSLAVLLITDMYIQNDFEEKKENVAKLTETNIINENTERLTIREKQYLDLNYEGTTIKTRYKTPEGYQRIIPDENSFAEYLENKKLKKYGYKVLYYNGKVKSNEGIYDSVFDYKIPDQNLHQSADAVMFLRAEYLFKQGLYSDICFSFANGFKAEYDKWIEGYRIKVRDNQASWHKCENKICTYDDFLKYMNMIYAYCSSLSLQNDMSYVRLLDMEVGDVFLSTEGQGYCAIVVDMAINIETGEKLFMLAQSGVPAQQTQILVNPNDSSISPWYKLESKDEIVTPEWTFVSNELMRFK